MRTSEPKPHEINTLLVSLDPKFANESAAHNANFGIGTLVPAQARVIPVLTTKTDDADGAVDGGWRSRRPWAMGTRGGVAGGGGCCLAAMVYQRQ